MFLDRFMMLISKEAWDFGRMKRTLWESVLEFGVRGSALENLKGVKSRADALDFTL